MYLCCQMQFFLLTTSDHAWYFALILQGWSWSHWWTQWIHSLPSSWSAVPPSCQLQPGKPDNFLQYYICAYICIVRRPLFVMRWCCWLPLLRWKTLAGSKDLGQVSQWTISYSYPSSTIHAHFGSIQHFIVVTITIRLCMYVCTSNVLYLLLWYFFSVLRLFRKAQSHPSPAVMAGITMPCLKILDFLICPSEPMSKNNQASFTN